MKNKLIVTYNEDETSLSDLEKGLGILKKFPIRTINIVGKESEEILEVYLKNPKNREFEIHPKTNKIYYMGLEQVKESNVDFRGNHINISVPTNEGRYNYSFYSENNI